MKLDGVDILMLMYCGLVGVTVVLRIPGGI